MNSDSTKGDVVYCINWDCACVQYFIYRLLLTALARLLNQTFDSGSVFLDNSFAFRGKESFLQEVRHFIYFGSVGMLCYVDLTPSARTRNRSRLMSKLKTFLPWRILFNPFFLDLRMQTKEIGQRIRVLVGIWTNILFHWYLDDFDRVIVNLFSNGYALFWNEAVIAIPSNAVAPPVLEQFEVLLSELSLSAKPTYVVRLCKTSSFDQGFSLCRWGRTDTLLRGKRGGWSMRKSKWSFVTICEGWKKPVRHERHLFECHWKWLDSHL